VILSFIATYSYVIVNRLVGICTALGAAAIDGEVVANSM